MEEQTVPAHAGELLRQVRESLLPRVSQKELHRRTGVSAEYIGEFERGNVRGRNGKTVTVSPQKVALMFSGVPLGDGEKALLRSLNPDAAQLLETMPAPGAAQGDGDGEADRLIKMLVSLVGEDHHRKVLEFLWDDMDSHGQLKPRAERIASMIAWVETRMKRDAGDGSAAVHSL